jgi:hypothetical protein
VGGGKRRYLKEKINELAKHGTGALQVYRKEGMNELKKGYQPGLFV